jgi:hypothetical protein
VLLHVYDYHLDLSFSVYSYSLFVSVGCGIGAYLCAGERLVDTGLVERGFLGGNASVFDCLGA